MGTPRPEGGDAKWRRRGTSAVVVAAAVLLAALCVFDYRFLLDRQAELAERFAGEDRLPPPVVEALRRKNDPERAQLVVARGLVAMELDPQLRSYLATRDPAGERETRLAHLAFAGSQARRALDHRPASWQAAMLLGAATYLERSLARDPALLRSPADWDRPLNVARELAPGKAEPARFLVIAYLELWPRLSPAKRDLAHRLLRQALADPATFTRLIEPWLTVAADRDEAFAAVPAAPFAWDQLQGLFAKRQDWTAFRLARDRFNQALAAEFASRLDEADARRRGGDSPGARALYLDVLVRARPGRRDLPQFARALADAPPGPTSESAAAALRRWLDWTLELCLIDRCPLSAALIDRLTRLAGELPPTVAALAALTSGQLANAEVLERRWVSRLWQEGWAAYLIAKARLLRRGQHLDEAVAALDQVHRNWRRSALYGAVRDELAKAGHAAATAEADLAAFRGPSWPAFAWTWRGPVAALELFTDGGQAGLTLAIAEAPDAGAVVAVDLDGAEVAVREVRRGETLSLPAALDAGLHRLELRSLAGGRVRPATTAVAPPPPPRRPPPG